VVPCSTVASRAPAIAVTACTIACEGSAGVEKTLSTRSIFPSSQMQSVNVPPLSTAILTELRAEEEGMVEKN
jgi:hypothetical protein